MNDIKSRMKSVQSTMQITKAMELVATSKLRRAKERVEQSRFFRETLADAIQTVQNTCESGESVWGTPREEKKVLYIVMAGDRGLAGGYNANIFRLTEKLSQGKNAIYLPIGKKALDYYARKGEEIVSSAFSSVADVTPDDCIAITSLVSDLYVKGEFDRLVLVYTSFKSMLQQQTASEQLLPFHAENDEDDASVGGFEPLTDESKETLVSYLVPLYLSGVVSSAVDESLASECASRRNAMNSANKNADEIIGTLQLHYNRARQAAITQEITEIVSGAEAL